MRQALKIILISALSGMNFFFADSASALSISMHVPEKYTDVIAGERIYFEVEIKYPENPNRKDLRLVYEIKKDQEIITQSKFVKAIETQASFIDYIVIPESAKDGLHVINAVISDYEDLREEVSASFMVVKKGSAQLKLYFSVLLGAIIIVGSLVGFEVYRFSKFKSVKVKARPKAKTKKIKNNY